MPATDPGPAHPAQARPAPAAPVDPGAGLLGRRRAGSAVPVRWALAGALAVFCAVTGIAAGLARELTRSGAERIRYSPGAAPVLALPLAGGRGYWLLATVTGHDPRGTRSAAVYAAIDPARAAGGHLTRSASLGGRK